MRRISTHTVPLVHPTQFLAAVRDAGYHTAPDALSELVDNSIQAGATQVAIDITPSAETGKFTIAVSDNGSGMTAASTTSALQFGGSTRFNDRSSLGRFGMGLPTASLSLSRKVQVTSRTSLEVHRATLDIDSDQPLVISDLGNSDCFEFDWPTGTQVLLPNCDRIDYARMGNLVNALNSRLSRTYRYFIQNGVTISINKVPLSAHDPLMRFNFPNGLRAQPFGDTRKIPFRVSDSISFIEIDFVELPIDACIGLSAGEKRHLGITGGSVMSVLRGHREVASGWLLAGKKRRENYDDWWRCEIRFEPQLDEHFGLTYTKQGIRPSSELRSAIEAEIEETARILNKRARNRFENAKARVDAEATCAAAMKADSELPPLGLGVQPNSGPTRYRIDIQPTTSPSLISTLIGKGEMTVQVNSNHPMHQKFIAALANTSGDSSHHLRRLYESLLIALARTDVLTEHQRRGLSCSTSYQELWGKALSAIMRSS